MSARCAFIAAQAGAHPIRRLCQVLGVSKAGYYAWHARQQRGPSPRARADAALAARDVASIDLKKEQDTYTAEKDRINKEKETLAAQLDRKSIV